MSGAARYLAGALLSITSQRRGLVGTIALDAAPHLAYVLEFPFDLQVLASSGALSRSTIWPRLHSWEIGRWWSAAAMASDIGRG